MPCRSLGDAVKQWRSRLAVTGDSATPQQDTEEAGEETAAETTEAAGAEDDSPAGEGEYEYMAEGEGQAQGEQQSLAPATEDQAKASQALDPLGLPDQDADDITAAEAEADGSIEESSERLKAEQALRAEAAGRQAHANSQQEAQRAQQQQDLKGTVADLPPEDDTAMADADEDRARVDDSYVSAQMQRASLSDGTADGLPEQDMVLAEGGLSQEAAQQLRQDVEMRVKAASEGTLQLDTSQQSAAYGQEVSTSSLQKFSLSVLSVSAQTSVQACR